jgi:hypothetical protein
MKASQVLVVLMISLISLISLVSISQAAGLRAMPELYKGECGDELSVPAPGILKNDIRSVNPIAVHSPETISIDPRYGTLKVNADGSFNYKASQNFPASRYVYFYYRATDGYAVTNQALVKIAVSCICHGAAPDVDIPVDTRVTPDLLMQEGAGCMGCRDVTPKFDLSQIPDHPVAGICYPYTVSCPGGSRTTGQVCFEGLCEPDWQPFTVCWGITPTAEQILAEGMVSCDCDLVPEISNIHLVDDHWEYSFNCSVDWLPVLKATASAGRPRVTETIGIVYIEPQCDISLNAFSLPLYNSLYHILPTVEEIIELGSVSCGSCDVAPVITDIRWTMQPPDDIWMGEYNMACTSANGCTLQVAGQFESLYIDPMCFCKPAAPQLYACKGDAFPLDLFISSDGGCRITDPECFGPIQMTIDDSMVDYNKTGEYPYTVICEGCIAENNEATGEISIRECISATDP